MNGRRRILVVDDDPTVRSVVKSVLEGAGYEVTTARDGQEAIMRIAASDYDVVLIDVSVPFDLRVPLIEAREDVGH